MTQKAVRSAIARRVRQLLRRRMKDAGHGTMAEVQRRLELRPGFFSEKTASLDVAVVLQVLRELEIPAVELLAEIEVLARDFETMPQVPAGAEPIAEYYRLGKDLEEDPRG